MAETLAEYITGAIAASEHGLEAVNGDPVALNRWLSEAHNKLWAAVLLSGIAMLADALQDTDLLAEASVKKLRRTLKEARRAYIAHLKEMAQDD